MNLSSRQIINICQKNALFVLLTNGNNGSFVKTL